MGTPISERRKLISTHGIKYALDGGEFKGNLVNVYVLKEAVVDSTDFYLMRAKSRLKNKGKKWSRVH